VTFKRISYLFILSGDYFSIQPFVYLFTFWKDSNTVENARISINKCKKEKGDWTMNWDRVEGQWKQRRGKAVSHWGKMMNDELAAVAGKHEQLVGILQEKYGVAKEEAKRQVIEFKKSIAQLKKSNASLVKAQNPSSKKKKKLIRKSVKIKPSSKKR